MKYPEDFINKVICGDCLEVMKEIPDNSIDAIITDPPYPREFAYLYVGMAEEAKRILKVGGSLLTIIPHYNIPFIVKEISDRLKWRWMSCMWQMDGQHPRMVMGVEVVWKPIGWWVKDKYPAGRGFVIDGFINSQPNKTHEWEQSISWANYCMKFVHPGDIVLDPFFGTGTLGLACIREGVNFIGIDNSPEQCEKAESKLK